MSLTLGKSLLFSNTTRRCSVVPYTIRNGVLYFLLGRDKVFHNLTDLGGGIKKNELAIRGGALIGGVREFMEESNGVFGKMFYHPDVLYDKVAIINTRTRMAAVFLPVGEEWIDKAVERFNVESRKRRKGEWDEIEELVWVTEEDFQSLVHSSKMWRPVRKFYKTVFDENLKSSLRYVFSRL